MNFQYTDTQLQIAEMIRDFADKHIRPEMMEWDEMQKFPAEVFQKTGELGLMGVSIPAEYGGSGLGYYEHVIIANEMANVYGSTTINERQKEKYLTDWTMAQHIDTWGLAQANLHRGTNSMRYVAAYKGDDWILNGTKNWITEGSSTLFDLNCLKGSVNRRDRRLLQGINTSATGGTNSRSQSQKFGIKDRKSIFVSYPHSALSYLKRVEVHVKPIGGIDFWSDERIKAGHKWQHEIEQALKKAVVAILLISADFLASDFIMNNELPPLLKAAESNGKTIIPVIVSPCRYLKDKNLSQFQAINDPKRPLSKMLPNEREEVYVEIADRVEELM